MSLKGAAVRTYYVSSDRLLHLLRERPEMPAAVPGVSMGFGPADQVDEQEALAHLTQPRSVQNPKSAFLPASESLGRYGEQASATSVEAPVLTLVGMRACDLRARSYFDKVMLEGEFQDALYAARRASTMIVSCDCGTFADTCFCTSVGGAPYATEGFDVNLTAMDDGFIAEVATDKGEAWLGAEDLPEASPEQLQRRDRQRQEAVEELKRRNAEFELSVSDDAAPSLPEGDEPAWNRYGADCVECAACTNICPTCHCFYLYDQALGSEEFERVRIWDSCLLGTYHRMAGGAGMKLTPRPNLSSRLANRVLHKFVYSPQQYGVLGCVGCGRCVEACLGALDIRRIVGEIAR
jgi:sulfhydrogenase subunit beta (sulfur reductase)